MHVLKLRICCYACQTPFLRTLLQEGGGRQVEFSFRKLRFLYNEEEGVFQKLKYYTKVGPT